MSHAFQHSWGLSLLLSLYLISSVSTSHVYIVYLGHNQNKAPDLTSKHHLQLLSTVFTSKKDAKQAMLYSYKHGFSGFSATLNSTQAQVLSNTKGVISIFKSKTVHLHTTRSWDFLGLSMDYSTEKATPMWQQAYGGDVIVGVFDTGERFSYSFQTYLILSIWTESHSFREEPGMGPVPAWWKGKCVSGEHFDPATACNRKLIGATYYLGGFERRYGKLNKTRNLEYESPLDAVGHGTHVASTAVGSVVKNASFLGGFGQGTARGGAPRARLAVYKVCWNVNLEGRCTEADIMAAFDQALRDGVNVISGSFGLRPPLRAFFATAASIGSFHAMQMGVSVVFSAGNSGPDPSLVENVFPWSISVAASTIDRSFPTRIVLDCALSFLGEGFVAHPITAILSNASNYFSSGVCRTESVKNVTAKADGKIILCFSSMGSVRRDEAEAAARNRSAAGLIFVEPLSRPFPDITILPLLLLDIIQGTKMAQYLSRSIDRPPTIQIFPSKTVLKRAPAPIVADFSSRGPSSISPDFLKPDISAPGINILAAWPPMSPPTPTLDDRRSVDWNFQSGTSMSCPHVSGVVALLKSAHPDWSPAAIRSALMTTAYTTDTSNDQILAVGSIKASDPFDIGAGHINPLRAMDPGLVYEMKPEDYLVFLCNIGYTEDQIRSLVLHDMNRRGRTSNANLNYPSITVLNLQRTTTITRKVRNVGGWEKIAVYFVRVVNPQGVDVVVWPKLLIFSPFKQERTFYVTLIPNKISQGRYDFGEIVWSDGFHHVRSPLVILVNTAAVGGHGFQAIANI
ncbi:unnamed protein product [Coffea canephora]|uniref:Uncharacterized protein n=1 Tax=Coffea canephora TaxID=49390 RepID=A0A068VCL4_COFCA|nr:unnamed protein product [Coffea canephora]